MTVEDTVKQGQASQEAETNKQEATDVHDVQVGTMCPGVSYLIQISSTQQNLNRNSI